MFCKSRPLEQLGLVVGVRDRKRSQGSGGADVFYTQFLVTKLKLVKPSANKFHLHSETTVLRRETGALLRNQRTCVYPQFSRATVHFLRYSSKRSRVSVVFQIFVLN